MIKLNEIKSWKNRFKEKLIDITEFRNFEDVLEDERLGTFMNTPIKDLAKESNEVGMSYIYLWDNIKGLENVTMKEYLKDLYNSKINLIKERRIKFYISEGKEIQGLIFYTISNPHFTTGEVYASNLSFFSFDLNSNQIILIKDMYILLKELISKYSEVRWNADVRNPACEMYKKVCSKLGGSYIIEKENPNIIYFEIPGNPFYERFDRLTKNKRILELREKRIRELDGEYL